VGQVSFQMGFRNGMYAFTAAVLGGIGKLPGAVLGGLVIGVVYAFAAYFGLQDWESAIVFGMLIVLLVFRPTGLLGSSAKEKV
jgi:branched-chain amino acid transport system permease protein